MHYSWVEEDDFEYGWRKMILSMGAGQLDPWSRVSHSLIITLLPSCFNDDIKIENFVYESLMMI